MAYRRAVSKQSFPEGHLAGVGLLRGRVSRARRVGVSMPAVLQLSPNCEVSAELHNLSSDGFRLRSKIALRAGQKFRMRIDRETLHCQIKWVNSVEAGGVFLNAPKVSEW